MAFHNKVNAIASLSPNVAVVPECADAKTFLRKAKEPPLLLGDWIGHNHNKGLGVFVGQQEVVRRHPLFSSEFSHFLPLVVEGALRFHLLAVWAFSHRAPRGTSGYAYEAIEHYEDFLRSAPAIVAGDFNNSSIWDRPGAANNMEALRDRLADFELHSAYHSHSKEAFGREASPTHYFRRSSNTFHIDYCFVPTSWEIASVRLESSKRWLGLSDHAPLIVDLQVPHARAS